MNPWLYGLYIALVAAGTILIDDLATAGGVILIAAAWHLPIKESKP